MDALTHAYRDHPKTALFTAAAALRVLLACAFPGLPDVLTARVELSTPVNSFKRLQEGVFLYERGLDPYDGGLFHQAPLFLPLFALLPAPSTRVGQLASILLYTALDLLVADCLHRIAASGAAHTSRLFVSPRQPRAWHPLSVAAVYLFNPFTLLTCLARPTTVFTTLFTALSVSHACQARMVTAAFALAMASYISLHPLLLLPPIGLLCYDRLCLRAANEDEAANTAHNGKAEDAPPTTKLATDQRTHPKPLSYALHLLLTFTTTLALLLLLSTTLLPPSSPPFAFTTSLYLTPLTLPDLTPNPGLWWYFFIEIFAPFRAFFLGVFCLHMLSYSIPLSLRFRAQPLAAVVLMMGVVAVFEPYASIGAAGAWLSFSSTHRQTFPALSALLYTTLLAPAFHHLWLAAGSGNANFFYAITLAWSLALLVLLTDTVYAVLRDEWEAERTGGRDGGGGGVRGEEVRGRDVRQI
ncbi:hypothetical protein LTR08_000334 [Meristemomyces frigidus]|nr:hypothetical protein LTR08_000334 [Meristemomyces frigidus]